MTDKIRGPAIDRQLEGVLAIMKDLVRGEAEDIAGSMAAEHLATGGKYLRARLALAAAKELGVSCDQASGWAAACELIHNGTLVHDDVQDGDEVRRGQPTVWTRHGIEQAINVGDLLLFLPFLALARIPTRDDIRWRLAEALSVCTTAVVRGQAQELEGKRTHDTSWTGYERAVSLKTSVLFQLPVEGAGLVAGRAQNEARRLAACFRPFGLLFQMQDDILDLFGDKGRNQQGSDIREGKISVLVVEHLALHPEDEKWLMPVLSLPRDQTPASEVAKTMDRFRTHGALKAALGRIHAQAEALANDPAWTREPGLGGIARELVDLALAPIHHLLI
jgi:geranylgeranyl diphosphate synthase, type I